MIEETENLARVREEKLKLAERQHELELEALKKVYAAEKKQVEDEFEVLLILGLLYLTIE